MTIAEIVQGLLTKHITNPFTGSQHKIDWSKGDYEKAWLVISLVIEKAQNFPADQASIDRSVNEEILAQRDFGISPSDYAELKRKMREWEGQ